MKKIAVLYHKNCTDGFSAAWAAWRVFGARADYIPVMHQEPPPEGLTGKTVYMLDFCYDEPVTRELIKKTARITAIDHHMMRQGVVALTEGGVFNNDNSGAVLAWQYFHPKKKVPLFLKYVEDNDIWRHKLPQSKAKTAYLRALPYDFKLWNKLEKTIATAAGRKQCFAKGALLLSQQLQLIKILVTENAELVEFQGHRVLAVNSPFFRDNIGHELCRINPPFGIIWDKRKGKTIVSLRSNGTLDVAALAARYGGGGHKTAAGFTIPDGNPVPWTVIS
jgi:oligoribonuclease NrnB/cAMP/cGMP phosphodiesterase (DHH superfamily)